MMHSSRGGGGRLSVYKLNSFSPTSSSLIDDCARVSKFSLLCFPTLSLVMDIFTFIFKWFEFHDQA